MVWTRLYLPFKLEYIRGAVTVYNSLSREGVIAGVVVTTGGSVRLDLYNSTRRVIRLTPVTHLVTVKGFSVVTVQRLTEVKKLHSVRVSDDEISSETLLEELRERYPEVCDLSRHPIVPAMSRLEVRAHEVVWLRPTEMGQRTPFKTEEVACRRQVAAQLEAYIERGYLRRCSVGERVFLSPLLPLLKSDGTYRFTTDFRALNAYFKRSGQAQVDVWRRLWEVRPEWRWYAKLDLKDGFFGVPVCPKLQRLFAFTWQDRRYCWTRLPQGWTWSSVLFTERIAEVVEGVVGVVQFADDLLVGANTKTELRARLLAVFKKLCNYGLKVNLSKAVLAVDNIKFLGVELNGGKWSLEQYLRNKAEAFGELQNWKDLERYIGVVSYARKTIPQVERLLMPVREALKSARHEEVDRQWWKRVNELCKSTFTEAMRRQVCLILPGLQVTSFVLETDWSSDYAGYLLFAEWGTQRLLCDVGSKHVPEATSSFLGEFRSVVWGCKATKAFRGDIPLKIRTDNHAVASVLARKEAPVGDKRAFRLWAWVVGNERFTVEFVPGDENKGADLLSRPQRRTVGELSVGALTLEQQQWIVEAHYGHFGWRRTLDNLRRQRGELWKGVKNDVKQHVKNCPECAKYGPLRKRPVFSPISFEYPNEILFLDFGGPWGWGPEAPRAYVLALVDGYSRFLQLRWCRRPTGDAVAAALRQWASKYGAPRRILMDRAASFTGAEVRRVCEELGVDRRWTAAHAHWSNGIVERSLGTILGRLRRIGNVGSWSVAVKRAEEAYNGSFHSGINAPPVEVFLGLRTNGTELTMEEWSEKLANAQWKTERDRRKRARRFHKAPRSRDRIVVGDLVSHKLRVTSKLLPQWSGPVMVSRCVGRRLFMVRENGREKGPFHYWQLKKL